MTSVAVVTQGNLGADFDQGGQVAGKVNVVAATTLVAGKTRFAKTTEAATFTAGVLLDASQAVRFGYTAVSDANYTAQSGDVLVAYTAITAPRTFTMPPAASFKAGHPFTLHVETAACVAPNVLTVQAAGSDTLNGSLTPLLLGGGIQKIVFTGNGSNLWLY